MATSFDIIDQEQYVDFLINDGVHVFRQLLDAQQIQAILREINHIRKYVMQKISTMQRPLRMYSDIAERHLGRLDYRCGFTAPVFQPITAIIHNIIKNASRTIDFRSYWGVITSLGYSGPTDLHRDVYPILNTSLDYNLSAFDINLPPYYFTVLIPLVEVTTQNGPTEFVKGSHRKPVVPENIVETYPVLSSPGDVIVFDGRTLHKGLPNQTGAERLVAYITFVANWYHDQTFVMNDFLFPELLQRN